MKDWILRKIAILNKINFRDQITQGKNLLQLLSIKTAAALTTHFTT